MMDESEDATTGPFHIPPRLKESSIEDDTLRDFDEKNESPPEVTDEFVNYGSQKNKEYVKTVLNTPTRLKLADSMEIKYGIVVYEIRTYNAKQVCIRMGAALRIVHNRIFTTSIII